MTQPVELHHNLVQTLFSTQPLRMKPTEDAAHGRARARERFEWNVCPVRRPRVPMKQLHGQWFVVVEGAGPNGWSVLRAG